MNRWLMIGSLAALLVGTTGCLHHNVRGGCASGNCASGACASSCSNGACGGGCNGGSCGSGLLGRIGSMTGMCGGGGCRTGCVPGRMGWQQGGLDYSQHLQPGLLGHDAAAALRSRPFVPGPPSAQVAYPYYTIRGPRDFLMDNPPSIGR